jgi:ribosomal protein S12 methylthiotransferase accessory factor
MTDAAQRARQLCDALVGRRSGIVSAVNSVPGIDGDAPLHFVAARFAQPHRMGEDYAGANAGGVGGTHHGALIAALAESVERYGAASYDISRLRRCASTDLDAPFISPIECAPFSAAQRNASDFPFVWPAAQMPIYWVGAHGLHERSTMYVPAFSCFLPWIAPDEPPIFPGVSTGLACAESPELALRHAVCEIIERDAVGLTWLKGITPHRLNDSLVRDVAGEVLPPADHVDAYDITSDLAIPVFMVICRGCGPVGLLVSAGTACDPDPAIALRRAAQEASQTRVYVRQLVAADPAWRLQSHFANVNTFAQHARLYSQRPVLADRAFAFLDHAPEQATLPHVDADPLDAVARAHLAAAAVDLTQPWAAQIGLHVVRAVVPGLFPLHAIHTLPPLGHPRLANVARALPCGATRHKHDLWPYPHPFA